MKFPNVKRYLSGILVAMLVLSSCGPTTTVYADEEDWPSLEEVIDQLDEDEIVRASDYEVAVGSDFNVHVDFANLDIPDPSRVSIYLDGAVNGDGEWFHTDHEDSIRTTYSVEPVSGHPVYRISRNIRVRGRSQGSTPAPQTTSVRNPQTSPSAARKAVPLQEGTTGLRRTEEPQMKAQKKQGMTILPMPYQPGTLPKRTGPEIRRLPYRDRTAPGRILPLTDPHLKKIRPAIKTKWIIPRTLFRQGMPLPKAQQI